MTGSAEAETKVDKGSIRILPTSDKVASGKLMRKGVTCLGNRVCEILSKLSSLAIGDPFFDSRVALTET